MSCRPRWIVLGLVTAVLLVLVPTASSIGDQGQIVVWSESADCSGYLVETFAGAVTGCRSIPSDWSQGVYDVSGDGSIVNSGETGIGDYAPVTVLHPDGQVVVADPVPDDFDASISPDGSKVAFGRYTSNPISPSSDIYTVNSDGSGLMKIASGGSGELLSKPTFSPDGRSIAYSCEPATFSVTSTECGPLPDGSFRNAGLMLMNSNGTDKRMIMIGYSDEDLSWSPNGQWIARSDGERVCPCGNLFSYIGQIFVYRSDGSDLFNAGDPSRQVTHETDVVGAVDPQFSADGTQIIYLKTINDQGSEGNFPFIINRDGTNRHELNLSPDGLPWGKVVPASGEGPAPTVNVMRITVPSLHGLGYRAAKRQIQRAHLTVGKVRHRYSPRIPPNHVVAQYPRRGAQAHRSTKHGPPVNLILSRGAKHR